MTKTKLALAALILFPGCAAAPKRDAGWQDARGGTTLAVPVVDSRPSTPPPTPRGRLAIVLPRRLAENTVDLFVFRYPRAFPFDVAEALAEDAKSAFGPAFEAVEVLNAPPRNGFDYVLEPDLTNLTIDPAVSAFGLATQFTMTATLRSTLSTIDGAPLWVYESRSGRYSGGWGSMWTASQAEVAQKAYPPLAEASGKAVSDVVRKAAEEFFRKGVPVAPARAAAVASVVAAPAPASRRVSDVDELPLAGAPRKGHAIIIGIERYREKLPKADFAASDASTMAKYAHRVLGFPEENVTLLTNDKATRGDFEKYFERWLANRVEKGDEVFVYFSGHGAPNPKTGDAYLVPFDADPTYLAETGYPLKKMYAALARLPAKKVTVALDSCFSGAGGRSVLAKGARPLVTVQAAQAPAGITVMAASAGDQISNTYDEKGHGLFTYFLLKGLKEKGADLRAAFDFAKPEVWKVARREYNADQEPQWREGK